MPSAQEARPLADWAYTRLRRAARWAEFTPNLAMLVVGVWLFDLHRTFDTHGPISLAVRLFPEVIFGATALLHVIKARYANGFAVIATDAATLIEATQPERPQSLVVRRRSAAAEAAVEFAVAGLVAAGWTTHLLTTGTPWSVLRTIATCILGGAVALGINAGVRAIRRSRRNGGVLADLDCNGVQLAPNAPRLPWFRFSAATLRSRTGSVQLILTGRNGQLDTVTIDADQAVGEPLALLLTARRFIAAEPDRPLNASTSA